MHKQKLPLFFVRLIGKRERKQIYSVLAPLNKYDSYDLLYTPTDTVNQTEVPDNKRRKPIQRREHREVFQNGGHKNRPSPQN